PRQWLELFGGLALNYLDERLSDEQHREAQEQFGLGARVWLPMPWLGGTFESRILARFGDTQDLEEGRGIFFSMDAHLKWQRRLGRYLNFYSLAHALNTLDRSPLGADHAVYEARMGLVTTSKGIALQGYGYIAHREQEEFLQGSFTDTYTDAGGMLLLMLRPLAWLSARLSGGYGHFFSSEAGTQSSITGMGHLMVTPSRSLRVGGHATYTGRVQQGKLSSLLRLEADISWRFRQLSVDLSYIFLLDDYRGIHGGDHRVMLRVVRTFGVRFGGKR
ncbi:MAG: hypothetical protein JRH20_26690, partial [Deltaproteobacteria bacterium]|nr:hypothetical protein [Deltaproteobacteria bacterium]